MGISNAAQSLNADKLLRFDVVSTFDTRGKPRFLVNIPISGTRSRNCIVRAKWKRSADNPIDSRLIVLICRLLTIDSVAPIYLHNDGSVISDNSSDNSFILFHPSKCPINLFTPSKRSASPHLENHPKPKLAPVVNQQKCCNEVSGKYEASVPSMARSARRLYLSRARIYQHYSLH